MEKLKRAKWIGAGTLLAMFFIGEAALLNPKGNYEWFPFYSWSMFALVPDEERNYLVKVSGSDADPPVDFRDAGALVSNPRSLEAYHIIQQWGKSLERGETEEAARLRQAFEDRYLSPGTRYRLHARSEDPLTLWQERSGRVSSQTPKEPIGPWKTRPPHQKQEQAAP